MAKKSTSVTNSHRLTSHSEESQLRQIGRFRFDEIEHTADKAIIAYGATFAEMLESAAAGMFAQQVDLETVPRKIQWSVRAVGDSPEDLLVAWLRELLLLSEDQGVALCDFKITRFSEWRIEGEVWGGSYSPQVRRTGAAVKAITYHRLSVLHNEDWQGMVTFDV